MVQTLPEVVEKYSEPDTTNLVGGIRLRVFLAGIKFGGQGGLLTWGGEVVEVVHHLLIPQGATVGNTVG